MIKFLDYCIWKIYRFVISLMDDGTMWLTAQLYLAAYMWLLSLTLFYLVALFCIYSQVGNNFVEFARDYYMFIGICLLVLCAVIMEVYYSSLFRPKSKVEESYKSLTRSQRLVMGIIAAILAVGLPVSSFVCFRLVVIGQVKWW